MNAMGMIGYRYRLGEQLGAGGMGTVYRAYDRLNATEVALKQVNIPLEFLEFMSRATLGATTGLWTALAEEFKTLASLRHPHIISVLDYGFDAERQPYYIMELLSQPTNLLDYGSDLTVPEKINLIIQVLQALAYLHRRGVIHRDLKPDNVLVVDEQAKVLDFGLAVTRGRQTEDTPAGTLHYMAPEVLSGQPASFSADLYAVGVMAWQLLAGKLPFQGDGSLDDLVDAIIERSVDTSVLTVDDSLSSVISKLLTKTPAERYASASECIVALSQALGQEPPAETVALRESFIQAAEFVGRQRELQQLKDALQKAISGTGSGWLVGGESGVGKSRLLDELRTQALVEGALVVRGQAVEGGGLPYQLWREPLRRLVLSVELSDLEAGILKPIVPDIATLLERNILDAPELPGEAGQQRLTLTIADVFKRHTQPVALLLEDLQWSSESLEPLKRLSEMSGKLPLLIVANYRSDERPNLPDELPDTTPIPLPRLSDAEIAELSAGMLGESGRDPAIIERLQQETEGNTFFMVEVVRALAETAGRLGEIGGMTLPRSILAGGIQKIVQRRLERVPTWGQKLLQLVAVAGRQIDLTVLDVLVENANELVGHTRDEWLRACADVAVLDIADERWRFAHDKLREGLLHDEDDESARLHRAVAQAIEKAYASDDIRKLYLEPLLSHWRQAQDMDKELFYGLQLAERYRTSGQAPQAGQLAQRLLELNERSSQPDSLQVRLKALRVLADAAHRQSEHEKALTLFEEAISLAKQLDDQAMLGNLHVGVAECHLRLGHYDETRSHLDQGLAIGKQLSDPRVQSNVYASFGRLHYTLGDFIASRDHTQQALALQQMTGDQWGEAASLNNIGAALSELGKEDEARALFQHTYELAQTLGARATMAKALINIGAMALNAGEPAQAEEANGRALELCRELGDVYGMVINMVNLGQVATQNGDWEQALGWFKQAYLLVEANDEKYSMALVLSDWGTTLLKADRFAEARDILTQALHLSEEAEMILMNIHESLGELDYTEGKTQDAEAHYAEALRLAREADADGTIISLLFRLAVQRAKPGQRAETAPILLESLRMARRFPLVFKRLEMLLNAAEYFARLGESALSERCCHLVTNHPLMVKEWQPIVRRISERLALLGHEARSLTPSTSSSDADVSAILDEIEVWLVNNPPM